MIFQWCCETLLPTSNYHRYGKIIQGGEIKLYRDAIGPVGDQEEK